MKLEGRYVTFNKILGKVNVIFPNLNEGIFEI